MPRATMSIAAVDEFDRCMTGFGPGAMVTAAASVNSGTDVSHAKSDTDSRADDTRAEASNGRSDSMRTV